MLLYNTVIFDLDGTIANTQEGIEKSLRHALKKLGVEQPAPERLRAMIGPPLHTGFLDQFGLNEEQAWEAVRLYRERYSTIGLFECSLYPGMGELLRKLKEAGVDVAVATAKPTVYAEQVIRHLGVAPLVNRLQGVGLRETDDRKEKLIRAVLPQGEHSAVMIGDRYYDIQGAQDVGIDSIGVLYGFGSAQEMHRCAPTHIAKDVAELEKILL